MKTLITVLMACLLWAGSALANPQGLVGGVILGSGGDCPSSTYIIYWDGDHSDGNTTACLANGASTRVGTNNGGLGSFGSDSGVTFISDAANERLTWALTSTDYSVSNTNGFTICQEFKNSTFSATVEFGGWVNSSDVTTNYASSYATTNLRPTAAWKGNNVGDSEIHTNSVATDGSYNNICYSYKYGEAGNDIAISLDGGETWEESDGDLTQWSAAENVFYIGDWSIGGSGTALVTRKIVMRAGYKQADIW